MQLSHQKDALWLLCREPSALVELPLDTMRPSRRIPLPAPPDSFDLSTSGRAAVASRDARTVVVVSLSRGAVERSVHLPAEPSLIQFRWDGRLVMAGSAPDRSLTMLDVETGKIVVRLPLPVAPMHFCAKPDGGELFISGAGMDAVVVVFPYSTEIGETILAGHAPGAMAVTDTSPSYLLVANPESDSLTALDVWTRRLVGVVRVGQGPSAITITPDKQYVLALNRRSGDMAVIRRTSFADQWVRRYKSASLFTMFPVGDKPVAAAVVRTG
jgi:YVTN family beta-propeller protein